MATTSQIGGKAKLLLIALTGLLVLLGIGLAGCTPSDRLVEVPDSGLPDAGVTIIVLDAGLHVVGPTWVFPDGGGDAGPQTASCSPLGATQACYSGPPGTLGVGSCHAGQSTCQASGDWGPCEGEGLPTPNLTDVVFILDNTDDTCSQGMGIEEFVQTQETALQVILDYPSPLYRWAVRDAPGCGSNWPPATAFTDQRGAIGEAGVQCVLSSEGLPGCSGDVAYPAALAQLDGGLIPWDVGATQVLVVFSATAPTPSDWFPIVESGVTVIQFAPGSCAGCGLVYPLGVDTSMVQAIEGLLPTGC